MFELMEDINKNLETIALEVVTLDSQDIPALGNISNCMDKIEKNSGEIGQPVFDDLIQAFKGYLEKLMLRETDETEPLEEGITVLQSFYHSLINQKKFKEDTFPVLEKLGFRKPEINDDKTGGEPQKIKEDADNDGKVPKVPEEELEQEEELDEDDRVILEDFVLESIEGLDSIEIKLMELEENPDDMDIINSIFRPFHTIKGVSGFVNLNKINKLAHSAESLLDKARSKQLVIQDTIVDIILEVVDVLKKMVTDVQDGLANGRRLDKGLEIAPLIARLDEISSLEKIPEKQRVGEILVRKGKISAVDVEQGLEIQKKNPDKKLGTILVQEKKTGSEEIISALREQKKPGRQQVDHHIKVDMIKLDNLVDLTGELVIAQAMLKQNISGITANNQQLYRNLSQLSQITSGLQTTAMSMRMVPIKATFQKMVRLVRDLAKNSGKKVTLKMSGEDTEIDRNVVEELYQPMVHMIRNSVDHGIETPDERKAAGKAETGTVFLRAYHQGGKIVVEIKDDGRGLDKERILDKAESSNIITGRNELTNSEIYNLIFRPGFSTAKKVTDISGRGVGMDVVKKAIEKLKGHVEIDSSQGQGSTFIINLPLTLAIIEGMVVRVGRMKYIIPALAILESLKPDKKQCSTVEGKGEMIMCRGSLIPLIRLDKLFNVKGDSVHPWEGLVVAVEHEDERRSLLLDELLGKEEVVIKNLGEGMQNIKGISGGAIMGDGRIALILDMAGIFELARQ